MPFPDAMRAPRRFLWVVLLVAAPWPYFLVERGSQPVASIAQMLVVTLELIATEGAAGAASLVAWMLLAQALLGALVLGALATVVTRLLGRLGDNAGRLLVVALSIAIVAVALTVPIYRTPFRTGGLHATLGEVFE
jgi:hypothetical protein